MKRFLAFALAALATTAQANATGAGIWYTVSITGTTNFTTDNNYTYGTPVKFLFAGTISGLAFWKSSSDTQTSRNLILWDAAGNNLAECTTSSEPTGTAQWVSCNLSAVYAVGKGARYIVSVDYPTGSVVPYVASSTCPQAGGSADATDPNNSNLECDGGGLSHWAGLSTFPTTANTSTTFADVIFTPCQ